MDIKVTGCWAYINFITVLYKALNKIEYDLSIKHVSGVFIVDIKIQPVKVLLYITYYNNLLYYGL